MQTSSKMDDEKGYSILGLVNIRHVIDDKYSACLC